MHASEPQEPSDSSILSPFSDVETPSSEKKRKKAWGLWFILGLASIIILGISGFLFLQKLNDPLRTLEAFPIGKYLDGYKPLAGSKFRANLRVENDLGWKEGVGRLMAFSLRDDPRPIVVMIPPSLAEIYFTKGQNYEAELEVKEGGLVYANSCRKN